MAGGIHDVLFRLTGDEDDARRSLEKVTAELKAFGSIHSEASADVDTRDVLIKLDRLQEELDRLDAQTTNVEIGADIGGARANIEAFRAELQSLPDRQLVDVDVRQGVFERMARLTQQTTLLGRAVDVADQSGKSFLARVSDTAVHFGPFTTQLRTAVPLMAALSSVLVAVVAALGALVASLAAATAGLAALAVAAGSLLAPAIGLAVIAVKRFQAQSDIAGTAAHALQRAFGAIGRAARTLLPAADPALRGLAAGIRAILPMIRSLLPAFRIFGRAVGDAFRALGREFASPAWRNFFQFLGRAAARVTPLLTRGFIAFFRIMRDIARGAMPFLIRGLRDFVRFLERVARGTGNIDLSGVIGQLGAWLRLTGALGRLFLGFVRAAAPAGQGLVGWLAKGAEALTDWINSAEGQETIKQFFEDVLPLAREIAEFIGRVVVVFLQLGQAVAPIVTPIIAGFNQVLSVISFLLDLFNKIPAPIRTIIGFVLGLFFGFTRATAAARLLIGGFVALGAIGAGVFRAIGNAAEAVFNWLRTAAGDVGRALGGLWQGLVERARAAWNTVRNIVRGAIQAVVGVIREGFQRARDFTRNAWQTIRSVVGGAIRGALGVVRSVLQTMGSVVRTVFNAIRNTARDVWNAIRSVVGGAIRGALGIVRSVIGTIKSVLSDAWGAIKDAARTAWGAIKSAITNPIEAAARAIEGVVNTIIGILNKIPGVDLGEVNLVGERRQGGTMQTAARGAKITRPTFLVGEESPRWPEYVLATNPRYRSRNLRLWEMAARALGIPGFAQGGVAAYGPGGIVPDVGNVVSGAIDKVTPDIDIPTPGDIIGDIRDAVGDLPGWLSGLGGWIVDQLAGWVRDQISGLFSSGAGAASGSLVDWLTTALRIVGVFSPANLRGLIVQAMSESGGNPRAINLWDSNAAAGHPSMGLLQTIQPTFDAYKLPGMNDIWNPIHNAVAAIRYMLAEYGHIVSTGSGYALGTVSASRGWNLVGERGPELVQFSGGETVRSHEETRRMVGGKVEQHFHVTAPEAQPPDPVVTASKLALLMRQRGGVG
jgi:phage-related protein